MECSPLKRNPAAKIFSHLTDEERIDQACELLALGVLRLAEKERLLKVKKPETSNELKNEFHHV